MPMYQRKARSPMNFAENTPRAKAPESRRRRELAGMNYESAAGQLSPTNQGTGLAMPHGSDILKSGMVGRGTAIGTMSLTPAAAARLQESAGAKAGGRAFKVMKSGGRVVLLVAIGLDTWEVYEAEDRTGAAVEKAGAWAAAATTTKAVGSLAAPLLGGGPAGWVAYGLIVGGAAAVAYLVGGEAAETLYESRRTET